MTKIDKLHMQLKEIESQKALLAVEEFKLNQKLSRALAKKSELPSEPGYYRGDDGIYELYEDGGWGNIINVSDVVSAQPLIRLIEEGA